MNGPSQLVNGIDTDVIHVADRGLQYGDGVFETVAVRDGMPQHLDAHLARLLEGCVRLGISGVDAQVLADEAMLVCNGVHRAVLKIILTRGTGGRGYRPLPECIPTRIVQRHPWPDHPEDYSRQGIVLRVCSMRLGHNPELSGIKHLNRLEQVLARGEWSDPDIAEGLMLDQDGALVEGTMSNAFLVRAGGLRTPDLARCGIAGLMRARVLAAAARAGIGSAVVRIPVAELYEADEVFVCNSIIGIWPVRRIGTRAYPVGPVTRRLQELLSSCRER